MSAAGTQAAYAVIGNPIAHSRSPQIHLAFGAQLGISLRYDKLLAPEPEFESVVQTFAAQGGRGLNVTLPFKERALAMAGQVSERAQLAGAANTLVFSSAGIAADNTDGVGLVTDLQHRWQQSLRGADVILLGAGGAARGVVLPLLQAGIGSLLITNRTPARAEALVATLTERPEAASCRLAALPLAALADWSTPATAAAPRVLINATATGLSDARMALAPALFEGAALAYDMVYASAATDFMRQAEAGGCASAVDGLGMLVEQAAESFQIWHGRRPLTDPVYSLLRSA